MKKKKKKSLKKWNVSMNWQKEEPTDIEEVHRKSYTQ